MRGHGDNQSGSSRKVYLLFCYVKDGKIFLIQSLNANSVFIDIIDDRVGLTITDRTREWLIRNDFPVSWTSPYNMLGNIVAINRVSSEFYDACLEQRGWSSHELGEYAGCCGIKDRQIVSRLEPSIRQLLSDMLKEG